MGNLFSSDSESANDDEIDKEEKPKEQKDQSSSSKKGEPLERISFNELQRSVSNVTTFDNRHR